MKTTSTALITIVATISFLLLPACFARKELKPGEKTKLTDLRIVCANYHRMIRRLRPWKTVAEIKALVSDL